MATLRFAKASALQMHGLGSDLLQFTDVHNYSSNLVQTASWIFEIWTNLETSTRDEAVVHFQ